ncbi:hypothetical protein [Streptomyces avidinii]
MSSDRRSGRPARRGGGLTGPSPVERATWACAAWRTASPASTTVPGSRGPAPRAPGLKIALTTLNTGRLSLCPCVRAGKWCLKITRIVLGTCRRRRGSRRQVSFIAATTFALEAVVDLQDDEEPRRRSVEAALANSRSEMGS